MIMIGPLPQTDNRALRWLPTGDKHAYLTAYSRIPNKPATTRFSYRRNHQAESPLPANRLEAPSAPVLVPSASAKSP